VIAGSGFAPKDFKEKPGDVAVAIMHGMELGLKPMQAVQSIAVINGRPSVWGDAIPALIESSGLCIKFEEMDLVDIEKESKATCIMQRRGRAAKRVTFTKEMAEKAGLWTKAGPWTNYPWRMLLLRARMFCARDTFPDVLRGMAIAEEMFDIETIGTPVNDDGSGSGGGRAPMPEAKSGPDAGATNGNAGTETKGPEPKADQPKKKISDLEPPQQATHFNKITNAWRARYGGKSRDQELKPFIISWIRTTYGYEVDGARALLIEHVEPLEAAIKSGAGDVKPASAEAGHPADQPGADHE
jgi:hypothetical protein